MYKAEKNNLRGIPDVPVVIQIEKLECAAACLTMILAYYGKWIPLEQVRRDCGVSRNGSNARNIIVAARSYGLLADGYRYNINRLKNMVPLPCVVFCNYNHFVVLKGFKGNKVYINDPAKGAVTLSMAEFEKTYSGVCLTFAKSDSFERSGSPRSFLSYAKQHLKNNKSPVFLTAIVGFFTSIVSLMTFSLSRIFMDDMLTGNSAMSADVFFTMMTVLAALSVIAFTITGINSCKLNGRVAISANSAFMMKILNVPIDFFAQRMIGDIQETRRAATTISNRLVKTFTPLIIKSLMIVVYGVIMLRYSITLTVIGIVSIIICMIISYYASKKRIDVAKIYIKNRGKEAAVITMGISMCESIKAVGAEDLFFSRWAGCHAGNDFQKIENDRVNEQYNTLMTVMSELSNYIVLVVGVHLVIHGAFTEGMILAFQGYLASFMEPAMGIVKVGRAYRQTKTEMERVEDVMNYPSTEVFAKENSEEVVVKKLSGEIILKNVSFGYAPLDKPNVRNLSFSLKPGKSIAIVGKSGCGKTSVAKLIAGLYSPWSGQILYDGREIGQIEKNIFFGSVVYIDQDIILFEDTIANNIKMWDESIEDFEMIMAGRDARIHDIIMERPGGYNYVITENGKDFSGGQRQLIEFARVLSQDPTIIIMDEATSNLDAVTESQVIRAVRQRGVSSIIISHRLSIVRSCDEIIVMDDGEIVDIGTHSELMERCEIYNNLVINE